MKTNNLFLSCLLSGFSVFAMQGMDGDGGPSANLIDALLDQVIRATRTVEGQVQYSKGQILFLLDAEASRANDKDDSDFFKALADFEKGLRRFSHYNKGYKGLPFLEEVKRRFLQKRALEEPACSLLLTGSAQKEMLVKRFDSILRIIHAVERDTKKDEDRRLQQEAEAERKRHENSNKDNNSTSREVPAHENKQDALDVAAGASSKQDDPYDGRRGSRLLALGGFLSIAGFAVWRMYSMLKAVSFPSYGISSNVVALAMLEDKNIADLLNHVIKAAETETDDSWEIELARFKEQVDAFVTPPIAMSLNNLKKKFTEHRVRILDNLSSVKFNEPGWAEKITFEARLHEIEKAIDETHARIEANKLNKQKVLDDADKAASGSGKAIHLENEQPDESHS